MRTGLRIALAIVMFLAPAAFGRPVDHSGEPRRPEEVSPSNEKMTPGAVTGLSYWGLIDTVTYGGTWWAADSARWEAFRDSVWTFEGGQGSYLNDGSNVNKPVGYHQVFDGWYGIDQTLNPMPYFRRSQTCVVSGSWSFWCGLTLPEANVFCYAAGQGYGNSWNQTICKQFAYPGSGAITLSYDYAVDAEPGFDYCYVLLDSTGTPAAYLTTDIVEAYYTGANSGHASVVIPSNDLPHPGHAITLRFYCTSDGGYSDEDALYSTVCGHSALDNIRLVGAVTDFSDFEAGPDGWAQVVSATGVGDYTDIVSLSTLPARKTFCPCGVSDSVLVFFNPGGLHPTDEDNIAVSPWIDLKRGGDVGRPGKIIMYNIYAETPLLDYIFGNYRVRYYPEVCSGTGLIYATPWMDQNIVFYYGDAPFCTGAGNISVRDYSALISPAAEQIQLAFGVLNLCATAPFGGDCSGVSNTTPWLDNLALGVYGAPGAPLISILAADILQDNFAQDGTFNPASTGRFDSNKLKNGSTLGPGIILCDTLVVGGDGGNTEVRTVFRVHPGPFTNLTSLGARAARWTPESAPTPAPSPKWYGGTWYTARLDTAEQGGVKTAARWMGCFHESDPGFQGTDRTPDPQDPAQNANEIFPDHLLTLASRIDYFFKARYIPPDPRNPSGAAWYLLPDTTGGRFFEVEILPSSMAHDTTWNCTLYVDHHHDRALEDQRIEEAGLTAWLGTGGSTVEGTRYDRFDNQTPSSAQLSFGRALGTNMGCSIIQVEAYRQIVWHSATLSAGQLTTEDASILGPWLTRRLISGNRFYASGEGLAYSMARSGQPLAVSFLNNRLGVLYSCSTIRNADCPTGSALDSTYCIPLGLNAGSWITTHTTPTSGRGNGCPEIAGFDLITPNSSVPRAIGDLYYVKSGVNTPFESVANWNTLDVDYQTVLDAVPVGRMRTTPADPHNDGLCRNPQAGLDRTGDVLRWFNIERPNGLCWIYTGVSVPGDDGPKPPQFRHALGNARPNPLTSTTRIPFVNAVEGGKVTLLVFDVTGCLVRTLVNGSLPAGPQDMVWDGAADNGHPVAAGLYFYRMTAGEFRAARKLVVIR
jgi:hypothetical protein